MDYQKIKNTVAAIEAVEKNIEGYNTWLGREIVIMPIDSDYFMEFQEWKKNKGSGTYDSGKNKAPMYFSGKEVEGIVNLLTESANAFTGPLIEELKNLR